MYILNLRNVICQSYLKKGERMYGEREEKTRQDKTRVRGREEREESCLTSMNPFAILWARWQVWLCQCQGRVLLPAVASQCLRAAAGISELPSLPMHKRDFAEEGNGSLVGAGHQVWEELKALGGWEESGCMGHL